MASPRGRILEAVAQVVALKGYAAATVADVVARAGVSRKTFYEHFNDKEDAFLAACIYVGGTLRDTMARVVEGAETSRERVELMVQTYMRTVGASPRGGIAFIIEARASTPKIRAEHHRILERFADLIPHPGRPAMGDPEAARLCHVATIVIVEDICGREIAAGRADQLRELEPTVIELATRMVGL